MESIAQILDLARWAPSGDNQQSWQFEIATPSHLIVYTHDTRADTVYDLDGHASQVAAGALLETIAIAATAQALQALITRRPTAPQGDGRLIFDVHFARDANITPSPLVAAIERRAVQRRPMHSTPLSAAQKAELAAALGQGFSLLWLQTLRERWQAACLMYANARLRLEMPEAYAVHRRIIDWGKRYSEDKVPDQALGLDQLTLKLMKWAMANWARLSKVNAWLGTWAPRVQMDLLPGVACAAHVALLSQRPPKEPDDYIAAGRALQRFWLTLTKQGYFMQPEMTPLIFARYLDEGRHFTTVESVQRAAMQLRPRTSKLFHSSDGFPVFIGRVGAGPAPVARSVRKPLDKLMKQ